MRLRVHSPEGTFDWESSSAHFRLGRGDACDLRIEGKASQFASWEHAGFSVGDDGAMYITDLGSSNGTYVDGVRTSGATPVRVGSIVQLGRAGPRLEVLALSIAAPARAPIPIPTATPTAVVPPATDSRPSAAVKDWPRRNWLIGAAVVLIALVGFFVASRAPPAPPPPPDDGFVKTAKGTDTPTELEDDPSEENDDPPEQKANPRKDNDRGETRDKDTATPTEPQPAPAPVPAAPSPDTKQAANERGIAAYRLIVVEDPKTHILWPHAGSMVVGEYALLTTAGVAVDLQKFRDHQWSVMVMKSPQGPRVPIERLRVHALFEQAEPREQLYFDAALLYVADDEPLADAITLASPAELAGLELGQPLNCIAIDHDGDALDRFHPLNPAAFKGKVFRVSPFPDPEQPRGPRLMHLRGTFGERFLGSPILNDDGHLVALYSGAAAAEAAPGVLDLHYAKLIDRQMIEEGLKGKDDSMWIAPVTAPSDPVEK